MLAVRRPCPARPFHQGVALLALLLGSVPPAALAADVIFRDDFRRGLASEWTWIREDATAWRTGDRGLEVRLQPGNLWGRANNARNVLVRPAPDPAREPLEITAVVHNQPTGQWEQVNLVWFHDESHMVKIGQELVSGKLCVVMGREEGDRTRTIGIVPLDAHRVELRLLVTGTRLHGSYRTAARPQWREVGDCEPPGRGAAKVSLQFYQGPPDVTHWARVEELVLRRLAGSPVPLEERQAAVRRWKTGEPVPAALPLPAGAAAFRLELAGLAADPPGGKADAEQSAFVLQDGAYGWTWDRRTIANPRPLFAGLAQRGPAGGGLPLPLRLADLQSLAAEMDVTARLDVDRGQHALALHLLVSDSATAGTGRRHRISVWFDWQGKDATGTEVDDGHRRYAYSAGAPAEENGVTPHVYRIAGFRGVPAQIDLKAILLDATRRLPLDPARLHVWEVAFGTESQNGSKGRAVVRRLDWVVNGQRWSTAWSR